MVRKVPVSGIGPTAGRSRASMDQQVVKVKLIALGACKSMNHAQKYLAQANRQIAELTMAESLLDALEGSLRIFEKHRIFLLSCNVNRPSKRIA